MNWTLPCAVGGTLDTAAFLAARPKLFKDAPGRAAGSVAFLGLWAALTARTLADGRDASTATVALASANVAANLAMLGIHLRHRVAGPRVFLGAALSAAALADAIRRR